MNVNGMRSGVWMGFGLIVGAVSGWLWTRGARPTVQLPHATRWEALLVEQFGAAPAALLVARMRARYRVLYAERPFFAHKALNRHLEEVILPGVAAYETLRAHADRDGALAQLDRLLAVNLQASPLVRSLQMIKRLPSPAARWARPFTLVRRTIRRALQNDYPAPGWLVTWLRDDDARMAFTMHRCFYADVLRKYGLPELTAHFCRAEGRLLAEAPPGARWERAQTLGEGGKCCDFAWRKMPIENGRTLERTRN
jgi:hypothetical protein